MINSFSKFLVEEEKTVYFTFGRMNPPTVGHEKLLNALAQKSGSNPYKIYLSQSVDNKKNPLQYKDKIKIARKMFPRHARQIMHDPKVKDIMGAAAKIFEEGYKNVVLVVGSDRVREMDVLLNKYNGKKGRHGLFNFAKITVVSAGERDPDADGVEGMSASKLRQLAVDGDFTKFGQGLPSKLGNAEARKIYKLTRKGLGLKEQKEYRNHVQLEPVSDLREAYLRDNLFEQGEEVVINSTGIVGKIKYLGSNYLIVESKGETWRTWLDGVSKLDPNFEVKWDVALTAPGYVKEEQLLSEGLWDNIRKRRAAGKPKLKPGQKGFPKTLDIEGKEYYKGVSKSTAAKRKAHFNKNADKPDNDPNAYKPAPGDARAKTKPSKHTIKFKKMFGEDMATDMAKKRIDREKQADKIKHDRMLDRARTRDTMKKNKETK